MSDRYFLRADEYGNVTHTVRSNIAPSTGEWVEVGAEWKDVVKRPQQFHLGKDGPTRRVKIKLWSDKPEAEPGEDIVVYADAVARITVRGRDDLETDIGPDDPVALRFDVPAQVLVKGAKSEKNQVIPLPLRWQPARGGGPPA